MLEWNATYASGKAPWDTGEPEPELVELVLQRPVMAGRALDIGCGTGTNALWLAARGFDVHGIDVAPLAIERAQAKRARAKLAPGSANFEVLDFVNGPELAVPPGTFQFVFDGGCLHVFDDAIDRAKFAARVAKLLAPGGLWLSLSGSTEGAARDFGPPRRSARELIDAIEPAMEILHLSAFEFSGLKIDVPPKAWNCLSRRREIPAQPSGFSR
jgi:SAM-dependent methyltransferase